MTVIWQNNALYYFQLQALLSLPKLPYSWLALTEEAKHSDGTEGPVSEANLQFVGAVGIVNNGGGKSSESLKRKEDLHQDYASHHDDKGSTSGQQPFVKNGPPVSRFLHTDCNNHVQKSTTATKKQQQWKTCPCSKTCLHQGHSKCTLFTHTTFIKASCVLTCSN